jgi:hypothetical protein
MASKLSGGCACGAIRYESDAEPTVMLNCHCSDCRKASGSGHAAIVIVQKSTLQLSGEARFHELRGGSGGTIERGFCPDCGSPLFVRLERFPNVLGVQTGSLDDPALHKPSMDLYTDSAPAWDMMGPETRKFARGPFGIA